MEQKQIDNYVNLGILKPMVLDSGEYRLQRPLNITIPKRILDKLANTYIPNGEKGGILAFRGNGNSAIICDLFIEVPNISNNAFSYEPNSVIFNAAVDSVLKLQYLPVVIHTHPTNLGFDKYDSKRVQFFLKSSKPDRQLARNGIVPFLNMPEAIFVKDERLNGGFGLNFFTGGIFPQSITALTSLQIGSVAVGAVGYGINKAITALAAMAFGIDFIRKPKYYLQSDGSLLVTLTA